jgi:hypothetical protein
MDYIVRCEVDGLHGARVQAIKMLGATSDTPASKYQAALCTSQKSTGFLTIWKSNKGMFGPDGLPINISACANNERAICGSVCQY